MKRLLIVLVMIFALAGAAAGTSYIDNYTLLNAKTATGITTDPDGQAIPYSSAPDIGLYEHHDTFVYGKGRLSSGTGITTVTRP